MRVLGQCCFRCEGFLYYKVVMYAELFGYKIFCCFVYPTRTRIAQCFGGLIWMGQLGVMKYLITVHGLCNNRIKKDEGKKNNNKNSISWAPDKILFLPGEKKYRVWVRKKTLVYTISSG